MKLKLEDRMINDIVAGNMADFLYQARQAHHADVTLRINGENRHFEGDWLKYLEIVEEHISQKVSQ